MEKKDIKVIAYYLPQYHEMEINNKWWGKGFTEWVNVKKAQSLFDGHQQPKIPLNNNYYDLSDINVMKWQSRIAKEHNVYGFCFYHYWFDNEPTMEKPLLNFLTSKNIDINYCICWANEPWTNIWSGKGLSIIKEQTYGGETEWKRHFDFLLPFFLDDRYIKEEEKPLLVIYRPYLFDHMAEMLTYWNQMAKKNGLDGIKVISQRFEEPNKYKEIYDYMDYHIEYQPSCYTRREKTTKNKVHDYVLNKLNIDLRVNKKNNGPHLQDYDELWQEILDTNPADNKTIAGAFVNEDTTPRHERRGKVTIGVTPNKFQYYMTQQIRHVREKYVPQYIFMFAWNEWGEGAMLEPESIYGYDFLKALKNAVENG